MDHPEFEVIENDEEISIHFRRITPIYPATEGLSQRVLAQHDLSTVERTSTGFCRIRNIIAPSNLGRGDEREAIRAIHFPASMGSARCRSRASGAL